MSHVVDIATELRDLECIKRACQRLGWELCLGQKTYKWFGQWVDDSPVPRNIFESEAEYLKVCSMERKTRKEYMTALLGNCTHAIKVPGCNYEIGLLQKGNRFIPIWDWYDYTLAKKMQSTPNINDGGPLVQAYAVEKAKLEALRKGYYCSEQTLPSGQVKLTIGGIR